GRPPGVRAVLHHQGARTGSRSRARDRGPHHPGARRAHRGRERAWSRHDDARSPAAGELMARLLVVDDDPVTCRLLADVFGRAGLSGVGETDPHRALARAGRDPVDLAILDVRMPEMDGLTLLSGLRKRFPALPVVIMTAFGSIETAVQAIASGAVDYVSKPM